jgi:hypothetical protein
VQYLSPSKQETLEFSRGCFRRGDSHSSTQEWRKRFTENQGIYDGSGQWAEKDLLELEKIGQAPITVNVTQGFIDAISGIELQTRHRTACRSPEQKHDKLAVGVTHLLYNFQEQQSVPFKATRKFRQMMIGGIGWSNIYNQDNTQYYEDVDAYNVIPDPDDLSPQLEDMKFVCRKRWMWPENIVKTWRHAKDYVDFSESYFSDDFSSPEIDDRSSGSTSLINYGGGNQSKRLVVEVQYKKPKKAYSGIGINGYTFETFDEDKAEALLNKSDKIIEIDSYQVIRTIFMDDVLLEHAPLNPNIPSLNDFTYIPVVWKREHKTGIFFGIVDSIKGIQTDLNVRISKGIHLINSSKTFIKGSLPPGMNSHTIREQLRRKDPVIILPAEAEVRVESNSPLGEEQFKIIEQELKLMQRVTGVNDEMLGIQTNASSAVSQNVRQLSSMRKNMFAFDNFTYMKLRESKFLLKLIQGLGTENINVQILDQDQRENFVLNKTDKGGKEILENDVRTFPIDLYIEEVPDYQSSYEEQKELFQTLLSNPNALTLAQSPFLLKMMGFRDTERVAEEIKKAKQEMAMIEQGGQLPPRQLSAPQKQLSAPQIGGAGNPAAMTPENLIR